MNNNTELHRSIFGKIEPAEVAVMMVYGLLCALFYELKLNLPLAGVVVLFTLLSARRNISMAMGCLVISLNFTGELLSGTLYTVILVVTLTIILLVSRGRLLKLKIENGIILFTAGVLIVFSTLSGIDPNTNKAISMFVCIIAYVIICENGREDTPKYIVLATIINGFCMSLCVLHQYLTGGDYIKNGRINFASNSKTFAIACAVPLLFLACSWILNRPLFEQKKNRSGLITFILVGFFSTMIIITAAKGVFFALIVGVSIFALLNINERSTIKRVLPFVVLFAGILFALSDSRILRVSRLTTSAANENMYFRFGIWDYYYTLLKESGPLRLLVGFGPGNVARIGNGGIYSEYYVHSTILDYLFSYGYLGLVLFAIFICYIARKAVRSKNKIGLSLLALSLTMYSTHGGSENFYLYIILALISIISFRELSLGSLAVNNANISIT